MYQNYFDVEFEESDDDSCPEYPLDTFITKETDAVITLSYDMQNRFPWFLNKMTSCDLMQFILENTFDFGKSLSKGSTKKSLKKSVKEKFVEKYNHELNTTFYVLERYFCTSKRIHVPVENWIDFCFAFTL